MVSSDLEAKPQGPVRRQVVSPARRLGRFLRRYADGARSVISQAALTAHGTRYREAWHLVAR
jgi:hypothetical protein